MNLDLPFSTPLSSRPCAGIRGPFRFLGATRSRIPAQGRDDSVLLRAAALVSLLLYWAFLISLPFLLMAAPMLAQAQTAQRVSVKDIETAIEGTLREEGVGEKLKVTVQASGVRSPIAEYQSDIKMYIDKFEVQKDQQHFDAMVTFEADGRPLAPIKVSGRYEVLQSVPVLIRPVAHGQTIAKDDLGAQDIPTSRLRKGTATEPDQLIGQTPLRTISANRAVRLDELVPPSVITKGTAVTIIFKADHLEVRGLGEALDNGAVGDLIRVRNRDSKRIVQGQVTDAHTVSILSSSPPSPTRSIIPAKTADPVVPAQAAPAAVPLHAEKRFTGTEPALAPQALPAAIQPPPATTPKRLEQDLQSNQGTKPSASPTTALPPALPAVIPDTTTASPASKATPEDLEN